MPDFGHARQAGAPAGAGRQAPSDRQGRDGRARLKRLSALDFSASIRPGIPALVVLNEDAVPNIYWQPSEPRLKRQDLANELKEGAEVDGVALSNPEPVLSVRTR